MTDQERLLAHELDQFQGRMVYMLTAQIEYLQVALHALHKGRTEVVAERLERTLDLFAQTTKQINEERET